MEKDKVATGMDNEPAIEKDSELARRPPVGRKKEVEAALFVGQRRQRPVERCLT